MKRPLFLVFAVLITGLTAFAASPSAELAKALFKSATAKTAASAQTAIRNATDDITPFASTLVPSDASKLSSLGLVNVSNRNKVVLVGARPSYSWYSTNVKVVEPALIRIKVGRKLTQEEITKVANQPYVVVQDPIKGYNRMSPEAYLSNSMRMQLQSKVNSAYKEAGVDTIMPAYGYVSSIVTRQDGGKYVFIEVNLNTAATDISVLEEILSQVAR